MKLGCWRLSPGKKNKEKSCDSWIRLGLLFSELELIFTLRGPVLSSVHSDADLLILSLGSNQETAKYLNIDLLDIL